MLGAAAQNQGDYARAAALHEECLILSRELGDKLQAAAALVNLANVSYYQGDHDQAREWAEEAKTLLAALGAKHQLAVCLWTLGTLAFVQGEAARAIGLYRESLTLYQGLGDRRGIAECLESLAGVAAAVKQGERAARLFGAADALRERIKSPLPLSDRPAYDRSIAAVHSLLPEASFAAAYDQGRHLPLEEAISEAMQVEWI